ncbi:MAG: hypothetical protein ACI4MJ_09200 [Aristaeellaceae bacterium]
MDHAFRRGLWLAVAAAVGITLMGRIDLMAAYRQVQGLYTQTAPARFFTAMAVMMIPGAFLASLPGRFRHRGEKRRSTLRDCIVCLLGGVGVMLGAGLAGGGDGLMLTGIVQGSVSAYAFLLVSWLCGLIAARVLGRGKSA